MSSRPASIPEMTCADFEKSFDEYVDGTLPPPLAEMCECHVAVCRACDREVTRWQQTRILLSTAVAEVATAVDVSSLWKDVEASLGLAGQAPSADREPSFVRGEAGERTPARRAEKAPERRTAVRHRGFAAAWRFASAATASAAAAAAVVVVLTPTSTQIASQNSAAPAASSPIASASHFAMPNVFQSAPAVRPISYTPPLAKPEVSHVDGIEAAPGHRVSTWVDPRSNARVIWVENQTGGAPVRLAGYER